jgi:signal peptidase I
MKKYNPHSSMREILDILAVALMVAFGIRALFFQPFKIPTSSMQPTLYGIHYIDTERSRQAGGVSPLLGKFGAPADYLLFSAQKADLRLDSSAKLAKEPQYTKKFRFFDATALEFTNGQKAILPGTPDKVANYTELRMNKRYRGNITKGHLSDGDHLFVNRLSLHLREPKRGDVMVFATENIVGPNGEKPSDSGDYYIKRLVGMPLDTLKIVDDVLYIKPDKAEKFVPVYELAPNMKKLYSGKGGYQGHSNRIPGETNFLRHSTEEYQVPAGHYFMLGDNTRFSADSRVWGPVPRRNLIGRPAIVFWPFSRRWGTVDRLEPLEVPTGQSGVRTFPSMNLQ